MKTYQKLGVIGILLAQMTSCNSDETGNHNDYSNKSVYNVDVGDTVFIYHRINSCCSYCAPNKKNLKHLEFIEQRLVVPDPEGCTGCNHTSALVFLAKNKGSDTIIDKIEEPMTPCSDTLGNFTKYIVNIR